MDTNIPKALSETLQDILHQNFGLLFDSKTHITHSLSPHTHTCARTHTVDLLSAFILVDMLVNLDQSSIICQSFWINHIQIKLPWNHFHISVHPNNCVSYCQDGAFGRNRLSHYSAFQPCFLNSYISACTWNGWNSPETKRCMEAQSHAIIIH